MRRISHGGILNAPIGIVVRVHSRPDGRCQGLYPGDVHEAGAGDRGDGQVHDHEDGDRAGGLALVGNVEIWQPQNQRDQDGEAEEKPARR